VSPAALLDHYARNRFVRPASADPMLLVALDQLAFSLAAPRFEPIELSPVCPLGTSSAVAPIDPHLTIATIRNTEVVSDSTNVMALECATRRRALLRADPRSRERVRLCASHRLVRPQPVMGPGHFAHFRLFCLCTAGRDEGSYRFDLETFAEHLDFYLRLLSRCGEIGCPVSGTRVRITDWSGGGLTPKLRTDVMTPLTDAIPGVRLELDPERTTGRGYYHPLCFKIRASNVAGEEHELADGGFTPWTAKLLSNDKERLMISAIGSERLCSVFRE
jgi:hypothetical protein